MERNRLLAGRYRFLRLLPGRAKGATWMALDEATGASVVASLVPGVRATMMRGAVGLRHERLASVIEVLGKFSMEELPEKTEVPKDASVAVAQWIPGLTFHERVKDHRPGPLEAVRTISQVASVVAAMHEAEVVHGGLSARAVLVERNDQGPVPAVSQVLVPPDGACFSPDRIKGAGPSTRDDLWALQVMLFHAITGQRPFTGTSAQELTQSITACKPPRLASLHVSDPMLQALFDRGFGPAAKRFKHVHELTAELAAWLVKNRSAHAARPGPGAADLTEDAGPPTMDGSALSREYSVSEVLRRSAGMSAAPPSMSRPPQEAAPGAPQDFDPDDDEKTVLFSTPLGTTDEQKRDLFGVADGEELAPASSRPMPVSPRRVPQPGPAAGSPAPSVPKQAQPPAEPVPEPAPAASETPQAAASPAPVRPQAAAQQPEAPSPQPPSPAPASWPEPPLLHHASGAPPPRSEPSLSTQPPVSSKRPAVLPLRAVLLAAGAAALLGGGAFAWFRAHPDASMFGAKEPAAPPQDTAEPEPSASAPLAVDSAPALPSAALPLPAPSDSHAPPPAAPEASASAAAAALPDKPADPSACIAALFPASTFGAAQPELAFVCDEPDPRKGAPRMRARIVTASRGGLTQGMQEWSRLGWYELVVWGVLRGACCGAVEPLVELPESPPRCEPLLPAVENAARTIVARDKEQLDPHVAAFEKVGMCMQFHDKKPLRYDSPPRSGGQVAFGQFVARALQR
jgi:serine/threonine protein kinase